MLLDVIRLYVNNGQFKDGLTVLLISCSWISGFATRSHTNRAAQPQKMARGLKFRI